MQETFKFVSSFVKFKRFPRAPYGQDSWQFLIDTPDLPAVAKSFYKQEKPTNNVTEQFWISSIVCIQDTQGLTWK